MQTEKNAGFFPEDQKNGKKRNGAVDFLIAFIIALLVTNLLMVFVFTISQVQQRSMEKTLTEGDQLIVERLSYSFREPERGDIIIFLREEVPNNSVLVRWIRLYEDMLAKFTNEPKYTRQVKRIIGIPGDEINIREDKVFLNGEELSESYIQPPTVEKSNVYPLIVPENQYFVMGDNRPVSSDSREYGCVTREQIEGRVWLRIWPLPQFGSIK